MRPRSKGGDKSRKPRRRKAATTPKRRARGGAVRRRRSSVAGQEAKIAQLERELNDALRQQTATAEILKVISGSAFDLQTVLDRLVESAMHLCDADAANIWRPDSNVLKLAASCGHTREFKEFAQRNPITPGRGTVTGRVFLERKTVHIPDVLADKEFTGTGYQSRGRYRSHLGVPMLREGEAIGVFALTRSDVTHYSAKQIELVATFANQAVIAIENARLHEAEKERTRELHESLLLLERERENKLMNVEAITASIAHEVRQPLAAIATNGSAALRFFERTPPDYEEVRAALHRLIAESHRASELFDSIRSLFRKTDQERQPIDVNEITLEVLKSLRGELADHGVTVDAELAPKLPLVEGHRSQLQQVISNLVHNAIEAMDTVPERKRLLRVKTEPRDDHVVTIALEDSGPGIDPKQIEGIFDAFVTTKPGGMGLGLAICRRIVESHGGQISAISDGKDGALFRLDLSIKAPA